MEKIRRQLTLFLSENNENIEKIRATFNPIQFNLIAAHITLCREDEIDQLDKIIENIKSISCGKPIHIEFDPVKRFENGKGVLIPGKIRNPDFHNLRKAILKDLIESPREHQPHITLMHPRNSTCTDEVFNKIKEYPLPDVLTFEQISLIEQRNGEKWQVIETYSLL
jgi:2'-5' RNA ligase